MGLALLLMGMSMAFLIPALRHSARSSAQGEIQQQLIVAVNQLEGDLRSTVVPGLSLDKGSWGGVLSMIYLADLSSTGQARWSDHARVYCWDSATERLWSKTGVPQPPLTLDPLHLTPLPIAELKGLLDTPNGSERMLGTGVQAFTVKEPLTSPVEITLRAGRAFNGGQVQFELTRHIAMRNSP